MIIGIVGSRRRKSRKDEAILFSKLLHLQTEEITKIVTGDCNEGGDSFAKEFAPVFSAELDVKRIKHPKTGEEMDFNNHPWFSYDIMCNIFYNRNKEIAKEPLDYLICLVAPDRKGGTENTIKWFKKYHKDWKKKLILI